MTNTIVEMIMGYGFAILLFAGLPAILFLVVFLPGLMRTTGETIGSSDPRFTDQPVITRSVPRRRLLVRRTPDKGAGLTMANTA